MMQCLINVTIIIFAQICTAFHSLQRAVPPLSQGNLALNRNHPYVAVREQGA